MSSTLSSVLLRGASRLQQQQQLLSRSAVLPLSSPIATSVEPPDSSSTTTTTTTTLTLVASSMTTRRNSNSNSNSNHPTAVSSWGCARPLARAVCRPLSPPRSLFADQQLHSSATASSARGYATASDEELSAVGMSALRKTQKNMRNIGISAHVGMYIK
jgi:hypothetical protein